MFEENIIIAAIIGVTILFLGAGLYFQIMKRKIRKETSDFLNKNYSDLI